MENLLKETIEVLRDNGRSEKDVLWVGTKTHKITWENFKEIADVEYSSGFGAPEVAQDLIISGNGFWMDRGEYDGSEWWNFNEPISEPTETLEIKALTVGQAGSLGFQVSCGWEDLLTINGIKTEE